MTWNNSLSKVPQKEKEGDYFLIKYPSWPKPKILKVIHIKNFIDFKGETKNTEGLILKPINDSKGRWDEVLSLKLRMNTRINIKWKYISKNELMAYL